MVADINDRGIGMPEQPSDKAVSGRLLPWLPRGARRRPGSYSRVCTGVNRFMAVLVRFKHTDAVTTGRKPIQITDRAKSQGSLNPLHDQ